MVDNIIILNWIIGGIASLLVIYASIITLQSLKRLTGDLKSSIVCLFLALIFYLFMGLGTGIMAVKDVDYNNPVWMIIPSFALIGALFFICGARKLFNVLFEIAENKINLSRKKRKVEK